MKNTHANARTYNDLMNAPTHAGRGSIFQVYMGKELTTPHSTVASESATLGNVRDFALSIARSLQYDTVSIIVQSNQPRAERKLHVYSVHSWK